MLDQVSLQIGAGEFVGIVGCTGCGKTTLLKAMAGLLEVQGGEILLDGKNIFSRRFDRTVLRRKVGMVFQYPEYQLFAQTVEKDVGFGLKYSRLSREEKQERVRWALEQMGFEIEASHHEVAEGQHEIDFQFGDVMLSADRVMTFKHVVKTYAAKHGLHATFMPKPIYGINGSVMHTNMSLYYLKDGKNAFDDPNGEMGLSETAYNFIAGIMAHIRGIAAFSNPTVNSYKRLVPGYEAPSYLVWSASNRSCLVRIPAARGKGTRVELRCPDPTCNPYLEMALCLAAGLDGIKKKMTPASPIDYNVFGLSDEELKAAGIDCLPGSLKEAIEAAKADPFIKETLGDHVFNNYIEGKENEWDEYRTKVSQWEIDRYLVKY